MIPRANITAWRHVAPWPSDEQVEQDLVLSRALVSMFEDPSVFKGAVFRGGTALHKLYFETPGRYSEDIDLVQRDAGPIGSLVNAIRKMLDPWLGDPSWSTKKDRFTLIYRFKTTFEPVRKMRLKVEINTREHFNVLGIEGRKYSVVNPWFRGSTRIPIYQLEELLGTKMRALYQRKKGRDLFDMWMAVSAGEADTALVVECFVQYMENNGTTVSRAQFESNMQGKMCDAAFLHDVRFLISNPGDYDPHLAFELVQDKFIALLPGRAWKGNPTK